MNGLVDGLLCLLFWNWFAIKIKFLYIFYVAENVKFARLINVEYSIQGRIKYILQLYIGLKCNCYAHLQTEADFALFCFYH